MFSIRSVNKTVLVKQQYSKLFIIEEEKNLKRIKENSVPRKLTDDKHKLTSDSVQESLSRKKIVR